MNERILSLIKERLRVGEKKYGNDSGPEVIDLEQELKKKDLIQWFDGGVGLVVDIEFVKDDWFYTIIWQDTKQKTTMSDKGLGERKSDWVKLFLKND